MNCVRFFFGDGIVGAFGVVDSVRGSEQGRNSMLVLTIRQSGSCKGHKAREEETHFDRKSEGKRSGRTRWRKEGRMGNGAV